MDLRLSVRVLNRARNLLVRPVFVLVALSVAGVAFAASATVSTDKTNKVTPAKSTGNRAESSSSSGTLTSSNDVLTALGATPTETMTLTGIQSIGDPVALMSINQGSAATSSTAAWIDSDVTDAVSMTFSPLFAQIDGGGTWACGVGSDGSLWRWGYLGSGAVSTPVQIGSDRDWAQVSVGSGAAAIKTNGSLWTFDATSSPTRVGSMTYRSVSVGSGHYLAITSEGWLAAWGSNGSGQLGTGNTGMQFNPVIISYSTDWKSVAAGGWHSAAVNNSGQLYTWGYNYYGQLGNASVTNRLTPGLVGSGYTDVFAAQYQTFALGNTGALYACGYNFQGALGVGDFNSSQSAHITFQAVGWGSTGWAEVAVGEWHGIGRKTDGTIWAWGYTSDGQHGTGSQTATALPAKIGTSTAWTDIAAADDTSFGLQGTVAYSWGAGASGCLGDGTTANRLAVGPSMRGWKPCAQHRAYTLAASDGVQSATVTYQDSLGNTVTLTDSILVDVTAPTAGASIQFGDSYTRSTTVGVYVYPSADTVSLRINGGPWGTPAEIIPGNLGTATLPPGDGGKTITIEMRDAAGNAGTATAFVTLDTTPPSGTMTVNGGSGIARFPNVGIDSAVTGAAYIRYVQQAWTSLDADGSVVMLGRPDGSLWGWGSNTYGQIGDGTNAGDAGAYNVNDREQPTRTLGAEHWKDVEVAGGGVTFGLRDDDTLWSWGTSATGLLGATGVSSRYTPGPVDGGYTWKAISGSGHALAVRSDGTLWAWGQNNRGQLGDGTTTTRTTPVQIGSGADWKAVAAGAECSFGIKEDGSLWAWGWNYSGRTGLAVAANSNTLVPTRVGVDNDWAMVAPSDGSMSSDAFAIGLKTSGSLWSWGTDGKGSLGQGADVTVSTTPARVGSDSDWSTAAAGGEAAYAIKSTGTLWTWGDDGYYGALAQGTAGLRYWAPVQIGTASNWSQVAPHGSNVYALTTGGEVHAWGYATRCAHGSYSRRTVYSPVESGWFKYVATLPIVLVEGENPQSITASYHDYAGNQLDLATSLTYDPDLPVSMQLDGGAATAPDNMFSIGSSVPGSATMRIGKRWKTAGVGDGYVMFHAYDGAVEFSGYGSLGQRGASDLTYRRTAFIYGGETRAWTDYAAGGRHSLAIAPDGSLWAWGSNANGQVGVSGITNAPAPVKLMPGSTFSDVFAGLHTSFAIRSDGTLWAWGNNASGELGDGTTTSRATPVQIGTATDWARISNWGGHTLALKTNGELWAWGPNGSGQLGLGDGAARLVPTRVGTGTGWKDISAGYTFSLAVAADGTLWTWGDNGNGQLGSGNTTSRNAPAKVGTARWNRVDAGVKCSFGIQSDGTLWAWGDNSGGQLGDGSSTQRTAPVRIGSRSDWVLVDSGGTPEWSPVVGYLSTAAVTADGSAFLWGQNSFGQLGNGTYTGTSTPQERPLTTAVAYAATSTYTAPWASGETTIHACYTDSGGNVTWLSDSIFVTPPAPVISAVTPANGDVAESATPEVTARVTMGSGNLPATVEVRVDGQLIASTYDYGTTNLVHAPTVGLADDTWHTAEVKVIDGAGQTVTATTSFLLEGGTKMLHWAASDCRTCHGAAVPHSGAPMDGDESSCLVCHMGIHYTQVEQPLPRYYNCYCHTSGADVRYLNWTHRLDPAKCLTCHTKYSAGLEPDKRETVTHIVDASACKPCHRSELRFEHALRQNDLGETLNCTTCHDSADPTVQAAITANDKRCATCHPGVDHWAQHDEPALTGMCANCHEPNLLDEHVDRGVLCDTCHQSADPLVTAAIAAGDGACASCHGTNLSVHLTSGMQPVNKVACAKCHWSTGTVGTSLTGIHTHATTWLTLRYNCQACHATPALGRMFVAPTVEGPAGAFATAGSATASADTLHQVHTKGSPSLGTFAAASYCNSCHGAVACTACHGAVSHTNHAWSTTMGTYLAPPVDMAVTAGVLPTAPAAERKTVTTQAVTCIGSGCHELSADGVPAPTPDCTRCHS